MFPRPLLDTQKKPRRNARIPCSPPFFYQHTRRMQHPLHTRFSVQAPLEPRKILWDILHAHTIAAMATAIGVARMYRFDVPICPQRLSRMMGRLRLMCGSSCRLRCRWCGRRLGLGGAVRGIAES